MSRSTIQIGIAWWLQVFWFVLLFRGPSDFLVGHDPQGYAQLLLIMGFSVMQGFYGVYLIVETATRGTPSFRASWSALMVPVVHLLGLMIGGCFRFGDSWKSEAITVAVWCAPLVYLPVICRLDVLASRRSSGADRSEAHSEK